MRKVLSTSPTPIRRFLKALRPSLKVDHRVHARFEVNDPNALAVVEELIADGTVDLVSLTDRTPRWCSRTPRSTRT
jgi:alpha-D-ribose 1-methylphosphonate 5-triphosphate diphosphatase PhnM